MLGTHTFFLVFLPVFFFFGYDELGREYALFPFTNEIIIIGQPLYRLCYALAFGVYLSSFLKDMVCSPRPFAPPVTRLSKSNGPR